MQSAFRLLPFVPIALLTACVQVPISAIDLSRQVNTGISSLGTNGQDAVAAWEEVALALLDERWSQIYKRADSEYRKKRQITASSTLTADQAEEVAGLAALIRDDARNKVTGKANEMRKVISGNTKTTLEANESVTQLLISANSVLTTQQTVAKQVVEHTKLPTDLNTFVLNLIKP
jgi:hypothetical protein